MVIKKDSKLKVRIFPYFKEDKSKAKLMQEILNFYISEIENNPNNLTKLFIKHGAL